MKRLVYITLFLFGLFATSCQKQEIMPNVDDMDAPAWGSEKSRGDDEGRITGDTDGDGIVDPDDEEDGNDDPNPSGKPTQN